MRTSTRFSGDLHLDMVCDWMGKGDLWTFNDDPIIPEQLNSSKLSARETEGVHLVTLHTNDKYSQCALTGQNLWNVTNCGLFKGFTRWLIMRCKLSDIVIVRMKIRGTAAGDLLNLKGSTQDTSTRLPQTAWCRMLGSCALPFKFLKTAAEPQPKRRSK